MTRLAPVIIFFFLFGCGFGADETKVLFSCASPDGKLVANFVRISGGGAAGYQKLYVNILESQFNAESQVFEMAHTYDLRLRWITNSHLEIGYPAQASIDHWQNRFGRSTENKTSLVQVWPGQSASDTGEAGCKDGAS